MRSIVNFLLGASAGATRRALRCGLVLAVALPAVALGTPLAAAQTPAPASPVQTSATASTASTSVLSTNRKRLRIGTRTVLRPARKTSQPSPAPATTPAPSPVLTAAPEPLPGSAVPGGALLATGALFSSASIWHEQVAAAPRAADSDLQVGDLVRQVRDNWGGTAAFNNSRFSVAFYTAPAGTPKTRVAFDDCQDKRYVPAGLYDGAAHFVDVPIPAGAAPAPGTDQNLTVYSPSTDQLWEFWIASRTSTGWQACWGGRIDKVSQSLGFFPDGMGQAATGLSLAGGMIRMDEIKAGRIDHAMLLNVIDAAAHDRFSWPAQRSDGYDPLGRNPIMEGTRFRLDPSLDVDALGLHPVARMIAKAAQQYGFIVNDKGGAVAVIAEGGEAAARATGTNPWPSLLGGTPDYAVLKGFPWHALQALPKDYGKR
jgi:hypothetical protein